MVPSHDMTPPRTVFFFNSTMNDVYIMMYCKGQKQDLKLVYSTPKKMRAWKRMGDELPDGDTTVLRRVFIQQL